MMDLEKGNSSGDLSTANNRMQHAFAGSYKTVVKLLQYLLALVWQDMYLENTLWSKTDPLEIVLLKASIFVPITTRRVFACIISPQDLNSLSRISNHTTVLYEPAKAGCMRLLAVDKSPCSSRIAHRVFFLLVKSTVASGQKRVGALAHTSVTESGDLMGDRRQRLWPYTQSLCMWCLTNKRWVLFKHSELKWERAPKKMSFLKELCSKSANFSRTFPKNGLSVTNFLVYGAVARRSADELSHD